MTPSFRFGADGITGLEILSEDATFAFCRGWRNSAEGRRNAVLVVLPASDKPAPASLDRLAHEFSLKDQLHSAWAARPIELVRDRGRTILVLEDRGGELLSTHVGLPMKVGPFLRIAVGIAAALGNTHQHGLIHKDIKPANILVNVERGEVRLTGFGIASRLLRERQRPDAPEVIGGTLAYMAPEQTGRMNRSIDSRSDLYSLGVTFYEMLAGTLPFVASDPMEWVHCHIARQAFTLHESTTGIPGALSSIVMKLLAKTAEERYQTAAGVEADLRRCLKEWESGGSISMFEPGAHDASDRLLIPEKLYGRQNEIATLLASFNRVVDGGKPELVLVSGYSGIGKSSVVNELHKPLVPPRGFFASGKFDQYKRDIPYSTLAQAFQSLIRPILAKDESELGHWRDTIREALGPNGQLMVDLVPELTLIIGKQPPVPELPPKDAQSRFQLVFRRFIGAFTRQHPLALFLDDLQWLDSATLDLMEDLLTHADVRDLMLIGAYRDNEVTPAHPLMRKLQAMRQAGAITRDIVLAPLTRNDLEQMIADALRCERRHAGPLAELVEKKTTGNPFFVVQFLSALFDEGLLVFDHVQARWRWDVDRIHAKGYTDNVVDLMVGKLIRLPTETQEALEQLACLGNSSNFATLRMVYRESSEQIHGQLWEAVRTGLLFRSEDSYRFLHDRVQEAAYSLIPEESRAEAHLRIGRLLLSRTSSDNIEEAIFEITSQLNRGSHLITSTAERERVAELNLIAGRRAKISTAYASALGYLHAGRHLLADDAWDRNHDLVFSIESLLAECELLTADMPGAESRLTSLAGRTKTPHETALVTRLRLTLYDFLGRGDRAVEVFIDYQRTRGEDWSPHPTNEEVSREYDRIWSLVGGRIEQLVDLPLVVDPNALDVLEIFSEIVMPAMFTDENLHALVVCRLVSLSLEYGNSDASCFAYVSLSMLAGPFFGNYEAGFQLGKLGYDLVEKHALHRSQARVYLRFGNCIMPWRQHIKSGRALLRRAYDAANSIGDLTFATYSYHYLLTNLLAAGDPLAEVQREAETGLEFASKVVFGIVLNILATQLAFVRTLRGLTATFGSFNDGHFDEAQFEYQSARNPMWAMAECRYWIRKSQALFYAGEYSAAILASSNAERLLWTSHSFFEVAEYHFYGALARAGAFDSATERSRREHLKVLNDHHRQLAIWAENSPENFENRVTLVGAEIARIEGRDADAMPLYEQAIRSARDHGFVQNEAVACEVTARFYLSRGVVSVADDHLRKAKECYLRWGADGKVQQIDRLYPHLLATRETQPSLAFIGSAIQQLDVASVVKASQALSSEIVLPKLIEQLMTIAVENAGADHGFLILPSGDAYLIQAEAQAIGDQIEVAMRKEPISQTACPELLIRYVIRTQETVLLDDVSKHDLFSADGYLRDRRSRSVLCLPLIKQRELIGILFLENALTSYAFTPARIAVLELLASQAAISLENTRLYGDLQEREAKVRRLVDSNIIGILTIDLDGQIIEANDAFLRMVGYEREDLLAGRVRWTNSPSEWRADESQRAEMVKTTGTLQAFEKEYFRKDGSRVPVLVGVARIEQAKNEAIAFVIDLTKRKQAEAALRDAERLNADAQMQLAHANRIATMGQLAASIAHEVNQPIGAALMNAGSAARWLGRQPPNLEEARQLIDRNISDCRRAADIVKRIRDLARKAPAQKEGLEINEVVLQVMGLARSELSSNGVLTQTKLADGLPRIWGDRVQLQQVILNLIMNSIEAMRDVTGGTRELLVSTVSADANNVVVAVSDSGPGLHPSNSGRIFEAFYTTKASGLGMGLSICRSIVEAHGGRLWTTPNEPHGAVFQMMLPVSEAAFEANAV